MKKSILKASFIAALTIFVSCNDDDTDVVVAPTNPVVENEIVGVITENVKLDQDNYTLTGSYVVPAGKTLTIEAGVNINAIPGDGVSSFETNIVIEKGGKIVVNGTAAAPVVISSPDAEAADWGGLIICGKAITSAGTDVAFEVGGYLYGGTAADDNSGTINYLVVKGSGAQIDSESQSNGISFCAVGSGTIISNVSVVNGGDDGVEFYGGSVSLENVYLENNLDDAIDWTESWNGSVTNAYIYHNVAGFSTVFEGDKDNAIPTFTNITAISNFDGTALQFKKESGGTITNLYLEGYSVEIDFKDNGAHSNVKIDGDAAVIKDDNTLSKGMLDYTKGTKVDISGWDWATK